MMSDLSNTVRNMKFMQRTSESRKKSLKKSSTASQSIALPSDPIITTPEHPGCWRLIKNDLVPSDENSTVQQNSPTIIYRNSVFSINDRQYSRLSFQNYNKRIETLMIKYGVKTDLNSLEDGEINPSENDDDEEKESVKDDENETKKNVSTLGKTMKKKFNKKTFSRIQFDNKSRVTKRRRRPQSRTSTN